MIMDTPQHRLKLFINAKYTRVKDFADDLGISPNVVSKYTSEGGSQFVTADKIERLRELGLNTDWYRTGEGEMLLSDPQQAEQNATLTDIKQLNHKVQNKRNMIELLLNPANAGCGYTFDESPFFAEVTTQYTEERYKAVRISGDSMESTIPDGSVAVFDTSRIVPINTNVVIAVVNGVLYCKQYIEKGGKKYLYSYNPKYEPIEINGFNESLILGVVVQHIVYH